MKVALVVGHRRSAGGAYGSAGMNEYQYYSIELAKLRKRFGNSANIKIFKRRDRRGYSSNMRQIHKEIQAWAKGGKVAAISFHFDAAANKSVDGHTVLYTSRKKSSLKLAKRIDVLFDKHLKDHDRGLLDRGRGHGSGFLNGGSYATALIEPFFASHQHLYMPGTEGYRGFWAAMDKIIGELIGEKSVKAPVVTHGYRLGGRSRRNLASVGNANYTRIVERAIKLTKQDFSVMPDGKLVPYRPKGDCAEKLILDAVTKAAME